MMDIDALDYSYSILAAAAFCHFSTFDVVHKVSGEWDSKIGSACRLVGARLSNFWGGCFRLAGLTWDSVAPCVRWMTPFVDTLRFEAKPQLKDFLKVKPDDRHNIQTHAAYLDLLVSSFTPTSVQTCHPETSPLVWSEYPNASSRQRKRTKKV